MKQVYLWTMVATLLALSGCKKHDVCNEAHSLLLLEAKRAELHVMAKDKGRGELILRYVSPVLVQLDSFPSQMLERVAIADFIKGWANPVSDKIDQVVQGGFLFLDEKGNSLLKDVVISPSNPRYDANGRTLIFDVSFNTEDLPVGQTVLQNVRIYIDRHSTSHRKALKPIVQGSDESLNLEELS